MIPRYKMSVLRRYIMGFGSSYRSDETDIYGSTSLEFY